MGNHKTTILGSTNLADSVVATVYVALSSGCHWPRWGLEDTASKQHGAGCSMIRTIAWYY